MTSADRVIEDLDGARALPAGAERERFLSDACHDEPALKEEVKYGEFLTEQSWTTSTATASGISSSARVSPRRAIPASPASSPGRPTSSLAAAVRARSPASSAATATLTARSTSP